MSRHKVAMMLYKCFSENLYYGDNILTPLGLSVLMLPLIKRRHRQCGVDLACDRGLYLGLCAPLMTCCHMLMMRLSCCCHAKGLSAEVLNM